MTGEFMPLMRPSTIAAALIALAALASPAQATSITDIYDPNDVFFLNGGAACTSTNPGHTNAGDTSSAASCASLTFTHLISPEFDPAIHTLDVPTTLTLFFRDDEQGNPESYTVSLDAGAAISQQITTGSNQTSFFSYDVLAQMQSDGTLIVNLVRAGNNNSDFWFEKSTVSANYHLTQTQNPVATPEPASLLLLGSGLTAVGATIRRRRARRPATK